MSDSTTSVPKPNYGGLSPGAKVGIGVSIGVVGLISLFFFLRWLNRRHRSGDHDDARSYTSTLNEWEANVPMPASRTRGSTAPRTPPQHVHQDSIGSDTLAEPPSAHIREKNDQMV